jgi:hypothetical protein
VTSANRTPLLKTTSWDHQLLVLPDHHVAWSDHCGRCKGSWDQRPLAVYVGSYRYVTGGRGRTTTAKKALCLEHAKQFAQRYGLELPAVPVVIEIPIDTKGGAR